MKWFHVKIRSNVRIGCYVLKYQFNVDRDQHRVDKKKEINSAINNYNGIFAFTHMCSFQPSPFKNNKKMRLDVWGVLTISWWIFSRLCHVMIKCPGATTVRVNCTCLKRGGPGSFHPRGSFCQQQQDLLPHLRTVSIR